MNPLQQAVNDFHRQGIAVIPVLVGTKKAAVEWKPYQERQPTIEELKTWFGGGGERNVAVICGLVSGGLAVLDVDDTPLANRMADDIGLQAETLMTRTPNDGLHIWARETETTSRSGPLVPGVADLKAGGGYVLVPPSSINGREYVVLTNKSILGVPNAHEWATGLLRAYGVEVPEPKGSGERLDTATVLEGVPEGQRDETLFRLACKLRRADVPQDTAEQLVLEAAAKCAPPFPEQEAISKVRSAYESYEPGVGPPKDRPAGDETERPFLDHAVLVQLSTVEPKEVRWLWPARIPLGKLSILAGDPGLMKSMLTLDMAARVTQGSAWPGGGTAPQGKALILTAEDDLDDTVRPRLDSFGADVSRVTALTMVRTADGERAFNLQEHLPLLEQAIEPETRLVIIDPLLAYTGGADTHVSAQVRGVLAPLATLAGRTGIAVVGVIHLNKRLAGNPFQRILASVDFSAAPRSVLLVGEDTDDSTLRHFAVVKNNLAAPARTLTFRWGEGGFSWVGTSDLTARQLLDVPGSNEERSAVAEATEFLKGVLRGGSMPVKEIQQEARDAGIAWRTVERAKVAQGVESRREGETGFRGGGQWVWAIKSAVRPMCENVAALNSPDTDSLKPGGLNAEPDRCASCGAEATSYAPNGKPLCDQHRPKPGEKQAALAGAGDEGPE